MLPLTILSALLLALTTTVQSAPAGILTEIDWAKIPVIPNPQTPAEYDAAMGILRVALRGTLAGALIFGPPFLTPVPIDRVTPRLQLHCMTTDASPKLADALIAISNLRAEKGRKCDYPAPRDQQCIKLNTWGEAAIDRCSPFNQRSYPLECSDAASNLMELVGDDGGCARNGRVGGYVSFKFHAGSDYTDINIYHVG